MGHERQQHYREDIKRPLNDGSLLWFKRFCLDRQVLILPIEMLRQIAQSDWNICNSLWPHPRHEVIASVYVPVTRVKMHIYIWVLCLLKQQSTSEVWVTASTVVQYIYMHTYMHTYIHAYIHTCIHWHIHIYTSVWMGLHTALCIGCEDKQQGHPIQYLWRPHKQLTKNWVAKKSPTFAMYSLHKPKGGQWPLPVTTYT